MLLSPLPQRCDHSSVEVADRAPRAQQTTASDGRSPEGAEAAKGGGGGAGPSGGGDGDGSRMLSHIASAAALTRRLRQLAAPYNIAHFTRSARKRIVAMQARPSAAEVPYATLRSQQLSQQRG
jgi:hypothetical protein